MAYKRVLINLPEELLADVDRAAKAERLVRNDFVQAVLRDRIDRNAFATALQQIRDLAQNDYPESEIDRDISEALEEVRKTEKSSSAT